MAEGVVAEARGPSVGDWGVQPDPPAACVLPRGSDPGDEAYMAVRDMAIVSPIWRVIDLLNREDLATGIWSLGCC